MDLMSRPISMPKYLPEVDKKYTNIWAQVISEMPASRRYPRCDVQQKSFFAELPEGAEEYYGRQVLKYEVVLEWGDSYDNGYNTFRVSLWIHTVRGPGAAVCRESLGGGIGVCEYIVKYFPNLIKYLPYVKCLYSVYGPMYYFENTCYHAGNRDFLGNTNTDQRRSKNGDLWWTDESGKRLSIGSPSNECCVPLISKGKERDLAAARSCANWPEATDEELSDENSILQSLATRLPGLMQKFKADIEELGFSY